MTVAGSDSAGRLEPRPLAFDVARRLWSWWDIVQQFNSGNLVDAISGFVGTGQANAAMPERGSSAFSPDLLDNLKRDIEFVILELQKIGLVASLDSANELRSVIYDEIEIKDYPSAPVSKDGKIAFLSFHTVTRFSHTSSELSRRVKSELSARLTYAVNPSAVMYSILFRARQMISAKRQNA